MGEVKRMCFFIMPFAPELHYFYLYLKQYIEDRYAIRCERADDQVLTKPILEKINDLIQEADVIIADCSGRNANVFYELGIAHAHEKKVILITHDPIEEAPSDIRHFEFIPYQLDKHTEFLAKLDNALHNVFFETYKELYEKAKQIFQEVRDTVPEVEPASREEFLSRVMKIERTRGLPELADAFALREFVLPCIIQNNFDAKVMEKVTQFIRHKYQLE